MKPAEILGMIEEASGTRMFEERKEKAVKTMAKKDKKVEEIASVRDPPDPECPIEDHFAYYFYCSYYGKK
jgi:structural maintenance of chromosome 2